MSPQTPTQAGEAVAGPIPYIDVLVAALVQGNLAAPIIITTVRAFQALWRSRRPQDADANLTDAQIIDKVETALKAVAASAQAEIDMLRARIAAGEALHG